MLHTESAPAKLTLYLHVTGVRADGFHELEAEMVSLDLADTLTFAEGDGLKVTGLGAEHLPNDGTNLVSRALALVDRTAAVNLEKRIPSGGGLGGGSADAGAVLRWAGEFDPLRAATLGADVPFCVRGGRARVTGIGEGLESLAFEERTFTVITPPFAVNTAQVFRAFDELGPRASAARSDRNHLEAAAIAVEPRLETWRKKIDEWTGQTPVLAGSGATWFVEGAVPAPREDERQGVRWVVARTIPPQL